MQDKFNNNMLDQSNLENETILLDRQRQVTKVYSHSDILDIAGDLKSLVQKLDNIEKRKEEGWLKKPSYIPTGLKKKAGRKMRRS